MWRPGARVRVPVKWALAAAIEKPLLPAGPGRARLRIGTRSAQGNPFDRPHRIHGQPGDSDPEPGWAASAKRIRAEGEYGFLHDGGATVLDRALADAEEGGRAVPMQRSRSISDDRDVALGSVSLWNSDIPDGRLASRTWRAQLLYGGTGMAFVIASSISYTAEMRSADVIGIRHERASNWGFGGLIAAAVLLSPVLAFLMALVVDIVIGFLNDGNVPALLVLVAAGAIGGFLFRKLRMRPQDSGPDWT